MPKVSTGSIHPGDGKVTYPDGPTTTGASATVTSNGGLAVLSIASRNLNGNVGESVFESVSGNGTSVVTLNFKNLIAGNGISLSSDDNTVTINSTSTGGGIDGVVLPTQGGTGLSFVQYNAMLVGNGSDAMQAVVPTGTGQFLYFDGTNVTWAPISPANLSIAANQVTGLATVAKTGSYADLSNKPSFATVAFSGSYLDLTNVPTTSTLPVASSSVLGGVKIASGLNVDTSGNLSAAVTSVQGQTGAVALTPAQIGAVSTALIGSVSGVASLDSSGKIPVSQLPPAVVGGLSFVGTWNAATNTPNIFTGSSSNTNKGWYYKVSVAGTTNVDGNNSWAVGDWVVSDGTTWQQLHNSETVSSVNGATGAVSVTPTSLGLATVATSGSYADLTNKPTVPTKTSQLTNDSGFISSASLTSYAPLASPTFTGTPSAPTATAGTSTSQIATTAFVQSAITSSSGVTTFNTRTGAITLTTADITNAGGAVLSSPAFTGTPTAPTAVAGTSTTQIATTAFVSTSPTIATPTLTGRTSIVSTLYTVNNLGSISGAQTIDLTAATEWVATITGNTTFTFTNVPAVNKTQIVVMRLTNAGSFSITWPASTKFNNATAPTLSAAGTDYLGVKYDPVLGTYVVFVMALNVG